MVVALCLFVTAIYLATPVLYPRSFDEMDDFAVGRSLLGHGWFDVDGLGWAGPISGNNAATVNGIDGHSYTPKDLMPSILALPFIKLAYLTGVSPMRAAHLSMILVTALTVALLYIVARSWGYSPTTSVWGAVVFGLASQAWPYASTLTNQVPAALGLLLAVWGVTESHKRGNWRPAFLGGLGMSLAGLSALAIWVVAPVFLVYLVAWEQRRANGWRVVMRQSFRSVVAFGMAAALGLLADGIYNYVRYGSLFETGFNKVGNLNFSLSYWPVGMFGMLFGTPTGLLWFVPLVVLVPFGVAVAVRRGETRRVGLLLGQIVLIFCLYCSYFLWWGGTYWGPRYLVPVMASFTLLALPVLDILSERSGSRWAKVAIGVTIAISVVTQLAVTVLNYTYVSEASNGMLERLTPPPAFAEAAPVLTNLAFLPQVQIASIIQHRDWIVLWMTGSAPDWLMIVLGAVLVGLASLWLVVALRKVEATVVRPALAAQVVLSIAFAAVTLARYPHSGTPHSLTPPAMLGASQVVAAIKSDARPGDGIVLLLYPNDSFAWQDYYDSTCPDVGLTIQRRLDSNARDKLARLPQWHDRIWLISNVTTGGNPQNGVERELAARAFVGTESWYQGFRMVPYTFAQALGPATPVRAAFGSEGIELRSFAYEVVGGSSRWINVYLQWQTSKRVAASYTVFVHLWNALGEVVAQHDGPPGAGFAVTSSWVPGAAVEDRHAVLLPDDLPPGSYRLLVGLYDPATGARLPLLSQTGDALLLGTVTLPAP